MASELLLGDLKRDIEVRMEASGDLLEVARRLQQLGTLARTTESTGIAVTPAKAGVQGPCTLPDGLDARFRGHDEQARLFWLLAVCFAWEGE